MIVLVVDRVPPAAPRRDVPAAVRPPRDNAHRSPSTCRRSSRQAGPCRRSRSCSATSTTTATWSDSSSIATTHDFVPESLRKGRDRSSPLRLLAASSSTPKRRASNRSRQPGALTGRRIIVPYKLLPDFYPGKGKATWARRASTSCMLRAPQGAACTTSEINIFGFSRRRAADPALGLPLGRHAMPATRGSTIVGNARVESDSLPDGGNQITRVTTYNRLRQPSEHPVRGQRLRPA